MITSSLPLAFLMGQSPMELFVHGGYIMWPILLTSLVAVTVVIERLMDLSDSGSPNVRLRARGALVGIHRRLEKSTSDRSQNILTEIQQFFSRPSDAKVRKPAALPPLPGAPIGACGEH